MRHKTYSDEFKLSVVNEYFEGDLGVRLLAKKYNLPTKNYISNWINELKRKGKLPENISAKRVTSTSYQKIQKAKMKTAYEKELEQKVERLEAELAFLRKYKELLNESKKK